jgi:hypothetical protein
MDFHYLYVPFKQSRYIKKCFIKYCNVLGGYIHDRSLLQLKNSTSYS